MHATPSLPPPILSITSLRKTVPGGRTLFAGLNLTVTPGEFVAIMGESGAGKSTLLNIIAGLDVADEGNIVISGIALDTLNDDERTRLRRKHIGFVFQAFHILPHLTLAQNVALPLVLQHANAEESMTRANDMLAAVGLSGRGGDYPRQLSGGELQRVAIARAIVHRPAMILADEPTGNLDADTAARILELLVTQVREAGAAVVLVTHSNIAASIAGRTLALTQQGLMVRDAG